MINLDMSKSLEFIDKKDLYKNLSLLKESKLFFADLKKSYFNFEKLPFNFEKKLSKIQSLKIEIQEKSSAFIVIGIGGSFLGAKAFIEAINPDAKVYFFGTSFSAIEIQKAFKIIKEEDVCINVISKSGSTLEVLLALSVLEEKMKEKYGAKFNDRIYITTEISKKNVLEKISLENKYNIIELEKGIVGRFSIFSLAGLIPMAIANIDVRSVLLGVRDAAIHLNINSTSNLSYIYAALRHTLYETGKLIEILIVYEPALFYFCEWWKQLFAESEGKEGKGIFPSSAVFSRDLHSMGQYIQDGRKFFFQTTINIKNIYPEVFIPNKISNFINNLQNKKMDEINKIAFSSTIQAHYEGNNPNLVINIEKFDEYNLGYLAYFFQKSCYLSSSLLKVNPFDNKSVDIYKQKMRNFLKFYKK